MRKNPMTENAPKLLTAEDVHARVIECRDMAKLAQYPEHRIMLDHMAGTWERIARSLDDGETAS
jgi:hypothetical protein